MDRTGKKVYLDYAATTPVDPKVLAAMKPYFCDKFGNTASLHSFGREAAEALEGARSIFAAQLGVKSEEIVFTSSASESNNTVLKGIAWANKDKGSHIIISSIEHDCIIGAALWLEKQGFEVTRLKVNKNGRVNPEDVKKSIKKNTILVSVMHANNEVGTIQPITEIGKICKENKVLFHTDASQTFGKYPINIKKDNFDLLTASSHKVYGPKGAALLYIRRGIRIDPLIHGGGHEQGRRSSTVNVPAIVGFAKALEIYRENRKAEEKRIIKLKEKLVKGVTGLIKNTLINGDNNNELYNIASITFKGAEGEAVMLYLDNYGIAVSTGSACSSRNLEPSHVLKALGLKPEEIHGTVRFSLGRFTTDKEINYVLRVLPKIVKRLRKISPFKGENPDV